MGIVLLSIIGFLAVISIIGIFIYLTRKNPIVGKNKMPVIMIGILQSVHILLYFTGMLAMIINVNPYIGFVICVIFSLICLLLSLWLVLPFSKFNHAIKFMFLFFALIQVFTTVVIFLLPDMGELSPLIQR